MPASILLPGRYNERHYGYRSVVGLMAFEYSKPGLSVVGVQVKNVQQTEVSWRG